MKKSAFTLAEIMIVLTVIGVLTGILMPIAFHSAPDEDVMKFKKGYNTITTVIREMVNSDKYFLDGDLSLYPDGTDVLDPTYNCKVMADILNAKESNCDKLVDWWSKADGNFGRLTSDGTFDVPGYEHLDMATVIDEDCTEAQYDLSYSPLVASDGTVIYETYPYSTFGSKWGEEKAMYYKDDAGMYSVYKEFCFDIDGIAINEEQYDLYDTWGILDDVDGILKRVCEGICPFGIGVRFDGKIILGNRAKYWLEKSVQKGE